MPALAVALAVGLAAAGRSAAARPVAAGVPLPRGSRALATGGPELLFASSRGFHDTVVWIRRWLRKQGLPARELPVYRRRGVAVARFLAPAAPGHWRAIHVFQNGGRTYLAVIPAAQGPIPGPGPALADPGATRTTPAPPP